MRNGNRADPAVCGSGRFVKDGNRRDQQQCSERVEDRFHKETPFFLSILLRFRCICIYLGTQFFRPFSAAPVICETSCFMLVQPAPPSSFRSLPCAARQKG